MRYWIFGSLLLMLFFTVGCSDVEPKTGTRVTFSFTSGKAPSRDKIAGLSRYLMARSPSSLGVNGPRVESVTERRLVLLLPGKKVPRHEVYKLLERNSLEFYWLANVATATKTKRPWRLRFPTNTEASYLFIGPDSQRISSAKDAAGVLKYVVGAPGNKPLLTGDDVIPSASANEVASGWSVRVQFKSDAAKRLCQFTKANRGEYLAFFYSGYLMSAAVIEKPIDCGEAVLTGFKTGLQAETAAGMLNSGSLPVPVKIESVKYYQQDIQ